MTLFFLLVGGIAYFLNAYIVALVFIGLSILETLLVILRATFNPEWVIQRRISAGIPTDIFRPGKHVFSLIVTKVLFGWILAFFAYHVSAAAGLH